MRNLKLLTLIRIATVVWPLAVLRQSYVRAFTYGIMFPMALTIGAMPVFAAVQISISKNTQQMSVSVDGVPRYQFAVSTGRAGYGTPNGTYRPQSMAKSWFSKEYYNSPMPHSIFFHRGYAIHGSYEISRLGGPASHGCVRLHPNDASALFALVQREGMAATTIVVYGSNPVVVQRRAPVAASQSETQPNREMQPVPRFPPFFGAPAPETFDPGRVY
jgi:hypothetical protein